jgi:hypothetical protein
MAPGCTELMAEINTKSKTKFLGSWAQPERKIDNLTALLLADYLYNMGSSISCNPVSLHDLLQE